METEYEFYEKQFNRIKAKQEAEYFKKYAGPVILDAFELIDSIRGIVVNKYKIAPHIITDIEVAIKTFIDKAKMENQK